MSDWLEALRQAGERGSDAVLVTVLAGKGSTPREAGAKLVVTVERTFGTVGGGELEHQTIGIAREMLHAPQQRRTQRFALGASSGQICGGAAELLFARVAAGAAWVRELAAWHEQGLDCVIAMPMSDDGAECLLVSADRVWGSLGDPALDQRATASARALLKGDATAPSLAVEKISAEAFLFERIAAANFRVVLFGAGHVGRAIARILGSLPCTVTWVDSRADQFPERAPDNVRARHTETPIDEVDRASPGSYFIVTTHSHALDFELVTAILARNDSAYCGMIGSATKRRSFDNALAKRDLPADALDRLTCPIGIASLKGKEPATIAIAVAAQLLELRERTETRVSLSA
jgi:xanthine dehydrogenase accessory factor